MNISNTDKAAVLAEALPYLQKYYNKVVVVKYGGKAVGQNADFVETLTQWRKMSWN